MQGPRLYRFFNYEQIHYLPAPVGGWNPDANPWELAEDQAYVLDNFLVRPGKIVMRGAFQGIADFSGASPPLNVCGVANPGQYLIARKSGTGIDPWNAVLLGTSAAVLGSGQTTMYYVNSSGVINSLAAPSADQIIGPRWINFDGLLYGISYDTAGSAVQDAGQSYWMKPLSLLTLSSSLRATQSGPALPGTQADVSFAGSNTSWTGRGGASVGVGGGYANVGLTTVNNVSDYLVLTNFGLNVPSGATITGIEVDVQHDSQYGDTIDQHVLLVKAGAVQLAADLADTLHPWPANNVTQTKSYGGSSTMWGNTWSPSDVNNTGFGVAISAGFYGTAGVPEVANIRSAKITVYYNLTIGASATPVPTVLSNAPHGAFDLTGYQSRIWLLGGIDTPGGGTVHKSTGIFFTNPITAGGGTSTADWKDPVSGLTNQIVMDNNTSDYGVALAVVSHGLLVLRRSSLWLLRGTSTANYSILPITRDSGCLDARSVVETDRGVYFMSQKGLMLTDGAKVVNVSGTCTFTLQQAIALEQQGVLSGHGGYITCGHTTQGQVLVSIGTYNSAGNLVTIWCGLFDPDIGKGGGWVRITSTLFANDAVQYSNSNAYPGLVLSQRTPSKLYVIGDRYLTMLEDGITNSSFVTYQSLYDRLPLNSGVAAKTITTAVDTGSPVPGVGLGSAWFSAAGGSQEQVNLGPNNPGQPLDSNVLSLTGPPLAIPTSATIVGIQVTIPEWSTNGTIQDTSVRLMKAGVPVGTSLANVYDWWPPSQPRQEVYGGPTSLWGTTWAPADINGSGFGVALAVECTACSPTQGDTAAIGLGTGSTAVITVYYTTTTGTLTYVSIPAVWKTKYMPIAATLLRRFGIAKRFFFDYVFAGQGIVPPVGWTVSPVDANDHLYMRAMHANVGTLLTQGNNSVSGLTASPAPAIQRQNQDFSNELSDLGFDVTWSDGPENTQPGSVVAEIYGIGIEWQKSRDRKS